MIMKEHKFKAGNIVKYRGDTYRIMRLTDWGYDVFAIDFTDPEDTKTGIGFRCEEEMTFVSETYQDPKKKKFIETAVNWLKQNADCYTWYNEMEGESGMTDSFYTDFVEEMNEKL